jgi:hypothetical protein
MIPIPRLTASAQVIPPLLPGIATSRENVPMLLSARIALPCFYRFQPAGLATPDMSVRERLSPRPAALSCPKQWGLPPAHVLPEQLCDSMSPCFTVFAPIIPLRPPEPPHGEKRCPRCSPHVLRLPFSVASRLPTSPLQTMPARIASPVLRAFTPANLAAAYNARPHCRLSHSPWFHAHPPRRCIQCPPALPLPFSVLSPPPTSPLHTMPARDDLSPRSPRANLPSSCVSLFCASLAASSAVSLQR